jgi:MraZ protein
VFRRQFDHKMDVKGRVSLPTSYRQALMEHQGEERVVVTKYFEGCLIAYAVDGWLELEEKIIGFNTLERESRNIQRSIIAASVELTTDKQGRILIPTYLRDYAALDQQVVFQGLVNRFEIWSKERWREKEVSPDELSNSAKRMAENGVVF